MMAIKKESRLMIENQGIKMTENKQIPVSGLTINLTQAAGYIVVIYSLFFLLILTACYLSIAIISLFFCVSLVILAYAHLLFSKSLFRTHPQAIKKLLFTELGWCYITLNNDRIVKADIKMDTIVTEFIVILNLYGQSAPSGLAAFFNNYSIIITAQEVGEERFRQLKRYLRLINFSKKEE